MFDKLPQEHRKQFIRQTFVYMPLSFLFGLTIAFFVLRFIGFEITLGKSIVVIILTGLTGVWSLRRYYRKLTTDITNKQV